MNQDLSWQEKSYAIVTTEDGSPSLHWNPGQGAVGELMHHRGGALSETEQIYGKVINQALSLGMTSFLSVGLGLGYNELVVAREISRKIKSRGNCDGAEGFRVLSYEADSFLVKKFIDFVRGRSDSHVHSQILQQLAPGEESAVLDVLRNLYLNENWKINGALNATTLPAEPYQVILYDAFSSKTNPELWSEDFLLGFLQKGAAPNAFFSTYACTGVLKRSLKSLGFEVQLREGFQGKRNSTLGIR
jgi:tRNA U34 5-methylaminomethyl-2-thiouridine-forming methyltransferase MnmC